MSFEGQKIAREEKASPERLVLLANAYLDAAEELFPDGQPKPAISFWPYRLLAIHSVELFLNAYLQANGISPEVVRGMQHNLAKRTKQAISAGLKLKQKTEEHLKDMTERREYLVARYDPDPQEKQSELTRLRATLRDIAKKVSAVVSRNSK